jgi:uncharacterized protein YktA (UPF0223 family)
MNERDNIIDWVTQVDMAFLKRTEPWNMFDKYEAFADLVRADEREACADIAENWNSNGSPRVGVAKAIRARGEK